MFHFLLSLHIGFGK